MTRRYQSFDCRPSRLWACVGLALCWLLYPPSAQAVKAHVIVLLSSDAGPYKEALQGLQQQLGSSELQLDVYSLQGDAAQAPSTLERAHKDAAVAFVTLGTLATQAVLTGDSRTPVVAGLVLNAEAFRHAGNATGITLDLPVETQFEWMQKMLPASRNVGVLYNPKENQGRIDSAAKVARERGMKLVAVPVQTPQELPAALDELARQVDVLWSVADALVMSSQTAQPILLFSFRNRIPLVGLSSTWVKAGALYSLDWDYADIGRQAGEIVQRIQRGARIAEMPPASPRKLTYALNLKSAQQLKLSLPSGLVEGARQVFE